MSKLRDIIAQMYREVDEFGLLIIVDDEKGAKIYRMKDRELICSVPQRKDLTRYIFGILDKVEGENPDLYIITKLREIGARRYLVVIFRDHVVERSYNAEEILKNEGIELPKGIIDDMVGVREA